MKKIGFGKVYTNKSLVGMLLIFVISCGLRLYKIYDLAEFLGDQGRTSSIIYHAFVTKTLPLLGPPVLTGNHLGPFYYYFLAPIYLLSNFHPFIPTVFQTIIAASTAVVIFILAKKLMRFEIALCIALLYAISPQLVAEGRTIWEPVPVPFFTSLLFLSFYNFYSERKLYYSIPIGLLIGILVQLHYPNAFFILVALGIFILVFLEGKKNEKGKIVKHFLYATAAFIITLLPFLYYEVTHNFKNSIGIFSDVFFANSSSIAHSRKNVMIDLSGRLFNHILQQNQNIFFTLTQLIIILLPIYRKIKVHLFMIFIYVVGLFGISNYKGVIFDHYIRFLYILPFFFIGFFFDTLVELIAKNLKHKKILQFGSYAIVTFIIISILYINVSKIEFNAEGNKDFQRASEFVTFVNSETKGKNIPFSFTIITYSLSDQHYRYFFTLYKNIPKPITGSYDLLYLICEERKCETPQELLKRQFIPVVCYDEYCGSKKFPILDLSHYTFLKEKKLTKGTVFVFKQNNSTNN